jgi:hypothetical protein
MTPGMMNGAGERTAAASSSARMCAPVLRRIETRSVICPFLSCVLARIVRKETVEILSSSGATWRELRNTAEQTPIGGCAIPAVSLGDC